MSLFMRVIVLALATGFTAAAFGLWAFSQGKPEPQVQFVCVSEGREVPCPTTEPVLDVEPLAVSMETIRCPLYGLCLGTPGPDVMLGTNRVNWMVGRGGNDRMYGNGGNDILEGRAGNDTAYGYGGADRFRMSDCYQDYAEGGNGVDHGSFDHGDNVVSVEYRVERGCS